MKKSFALAIVLPLYFYFYRLPDRILLHSLMHFITSLTTMARDPLYMLIIHIYTPFMVKMSTLVMAVGQLELDESSIISIREVK